MKTNQCLDYADQGQLDFIQRVGRIGYWEFDPARQTMFLPQVSRALLDAAIGSAASADQSFMGALRNPERQRFQAALDTAVANGAPLNIALQLESAGGKHVCLTVRGEPLVSEHGATLFAGTFQDITIETPGSMVQEANGPQLQTVLDALSQGVSVVDKDMRLTLWNRQLSKILDLPQERMFCNAPFEEFMHFIGMQSGSESGDPNASTRFSAEHQRANGRWLKIQGNPIANGGFVTSYVDITVRKQAEEALRVSEERWNFALEGSNEGVWDWNFQTGEVVFSKRWKEMFGYSETEIGNSTSDWLERVHPDDMETVGTSIELHMYTMTKPPSIEYRFRCKDGSWKWTLGRGMVVSRNAQGKPLRLVGTNSDISERKLIEAELVHSKELAETSREKVTSLLDNSGQGFLSFGADLVVESAYSRACHTMLGGSPAGRDVALVLFGNDGAKVELLHAVIPTALAEADSVTQEVMLSLLPAEIQREDMVLKAEYRLLEGDRLMLVLTDMTAERRMAAMLESERRQLELIVMAVADSRSFFEATDGFQEFLEQDLPLALSSGQAPRVIAKQLYREIHTYKGLLNQFSFPNAPTALHAVETFLSEFLASEASGTTQQLASIVSAQALQTVLDADLAVLSDALGEDFLARGESVTLTSAQARQLEALATNLLRGEPIDTAVAEVRTLLGALTMLHKVSIKNVLMGFEGLVQQAANRLEKELVLHVAQDSADIWVDPQRYRPFFRTLVHVFRNAVTHGIETPDARWTTGKDEVGRITCRLTQQGETLRLSIADDGAGISIDALRQRAVATGLYTQHKILAMSDADIMQLIFMDNISTHTQISELAGRGIGLTATLAETNNLGGQVVVNSVLGKGTEFVFELPFSHKEPIEGGRP